jgi:hypothetical protein|tara:strand:- start:1801 stop:2145 length:345 start_codon:yes stop_codon:yes gene_type:complete
MGVFSFITTDTKDSVPNKWQEKRQTFTVYLKDDKGNVWKESQYEGYGEFGGKDIYELIAEMNGFVGRDEGINIYFHPIGDMKFPNLVIDKSIEWENQLLLDCPDQGHFYEGILI